MYFSSKPNDNPLTSTPNDREHGVMPTFDVSAVWTDKDALLREWGWEEAQSVTPRQQSHQQPAVRGDEQERATTATTVAARSTVSSASTAQPFAFESPPPSVRPASPGESTQGDATPTGEVPGVNLSSRHAPCEPISEEQMAAMGWDATERSFAFYHRTVWRRFCDKYGHAKVHGLATERDEDTPRAAPIVLPENANGWLAGVDRMEPSSGSFFDTTEYDPLYPSYEEVVAEDDVPPIPTLSDDSFWRLYWESQASQAASEPLRFAPEYAAPTWGNVLPSPHRRPVDMQLYNASLAVLEAADASGLQVPSSRDTASGHGHAALSGVARQPASTAAELDARARPTASTSTMCTGFVPLAGPFQVGWFQGAQHIAARDANAIRGTHSGVASGVQLPFPAHFHDEGDNVASMNAVGMPLRSPTTMQYPEALTAAAVFEALGIEMAGGYFETD